MIGPIPAQSRTEETQVLWESWALLSLALWLALTGFPEVDRMEDGGGGRDFINRPQQNDVRDPESKWFYSQTSGLCSRGLLSGSKEVLITPPSWLANVERHVNRTSWFPFTHFTSQMESIIHFYLIIFYGVFVVVLCVFGLESICACWYLCACLSTCSKQIFKSLLTYF